MKKKRQIMYNITHSLCYLYEKDGIWIVHFVIDAINRKHNAADIKYYRGENVYGGEIR